MSVETLEFLASVEVKPATFSEWLDAVKARDRVPHVMGETRKPLKAEPLSTWRIV